MKTVFYLLFLPFLALTLSICADATPSGAPSIRNERRSMPVPDIHHMIFVEPTEEEKINMKKAIELLLKAEMKQEFIGDSETGCFSGLMEKMPGELPASFAEALEIVIKGLDQIDRHKLIFWDRMTPFRETTARNWLILEAYCRTFLGFSLELESVKMMGRMNNWTSKNPATRKIYSELRSSEASRDDSFEKVMSHIPGINFNGCADMETRQTLTQWYQRVFLQLMPDMEHSLIPPSDETSNRLDTNITGVQLQEAGVSFEGLPDKLVELLKKECEVANSFEDRKSWEARQALFEAACARNTYLIEQIGLSLDEYCGFMLETLSSLTLPPNTTGHDWVEADDRNKGHTIEQYQRKDEILKTWRTQGMPEFKYLGLTGLLFVN